jgi:geranylgeranyl pyrophosphate synthase
VGEAWGAQCALHCAFVCKLRKWADPCAWRALTYGRVQILELFHDVTFQTAHGQLLDVTTAPIGTVDLTKYTLSNYMMIVTYKVG